MKDVPSKSINMVLCDLPYNVTCNSWDNIIPFDLLWNQYKRIISEDGIIVLFGRQPFTSLLITSNLQMYRYSWIWEKETSSDFLNSRYKPLCKTEDVLVFSNNTVGSLSKNPIRYYPQDLIEVNKVKRNNPNSTWRKNKGYSEKTNSLNSDKEFTQTYTNYPFNIIKFGRDKHAVHPTQKPLALMEYLIKTYTLENEIIIDNCMGSGTTGVACKKLNRNFVGMELDPSYFEIASKRIAETPEPE
jgi:site-specific DNA-methyltransferase (adenine-specific)